VPHIRFSFASFCLLAALAISNAQAEVRVTVGGVVSLVHQGVCPLMRPPIIETAPDIRISESTPGEFGIGSFGVYVAAAQFNQTWINGTVRALTAEGADVSAQVLGSSYAKIHTDTPGLFWLNLTGVSDATTGPVTLVLSGFRFLPDVMAMQDGQVTMQVGGGNTATLGTSGAHIPLSSLKFAEFLGATDPICPPFSVASAGSADHLILTADYVTSANSASNQSSIPIALFAGIVLPDGRLFLKDASQNWVAYDPRSPASYGRLSKLPQVIHVAITDGSTTVAGLHGAQIVVGYGADLFGEADAFNTMLQQVSYQAVYTIP
jgi:hypothetical protein